MTNIEQIKQKWEKKLGNAIDEEHFALSNIYTDIIQDLKSLQSIEQPNVVDLIAEDLVRLTVPLSIPNVITIIESRITGKPNIDKIMKEIYNKTWVDPCFFDTIVPILEKHLTSKAPTEVSSEKHNIGTFRRQFKPQEVKVECKHNFTANDWEWNWYCKDCWRDISKEDMIKKYS